MNLKTKQLAFGIATFIPGVTKLHALRGTGGSDSGRYCYGVWMRHLVKAGASGLNTSPQVVAELGPGSSLGIGLAALLSGCERYFAFDAVPHAAPERNEKIFDELVALFKARAPIPDEDELPRVRPLLDSYEFPAHILDEERLERALTDERIAQIRAAIRLAHESADGLINYRAPWDNDNILKSESVDMLMSQAVLEHVLDIDGTYEAMRKSLKPSGYLSHVIDFKCHGTAHEWNGHWAYSDFMWKLILGRRPYLINRQPHSRHLAAMAQEGFDVVRDDKVPMETRLTRSDLAPSFQNIPEADMTTSGTFIQAVKPG